MQNLTRTLTVVAVGLTTAFGSVIPTNAFPLTPTVSHSTATTAEQVQYRYDRDRLYHDRRGWHRGHRGHRDYRPGYRRHSDGWWYPLAAFGAAAAIGGAIANSPRPVVRLPPRHVAWCQGRFKTYRSSDNTYIPSAGYRVQCNSPYF